MKMKKFLLLCLFLGMNIFLFAQNQQTVQLRAEKNKLVIVMTHFPTTRWKIVEPKTNIILASHAGSVIVTFDIANLEDGNYCLSGEYEVYVDDNWPYTYLAEIPITIGTVNNKKQVECIICDEGDYFRGDWLLLPRYIGKLNVSLNDGILECVIDGCDNYTIEILELSSWKIVRSSVEKSIKIDKLAPMMYLIRATKENSDFLQTVKILKNGPGGLYLENPMD